MTYSVINPEKMVNGFAEDISVVAANFQAIQESLEDIVSGTAYSAYVPVMTGPTNFNLGADQIRKGWYSWNDVGVVHYYGICQFVGAGKNQGLAIPPNYFITLPVLPKPDPFDRATNPLADDTALPAAGDIWLTQAYGVSIVVPAQPWIEGDNSVEYGKFQCLFQKLSLAWPQQRTWARPNEPFAWANEGDSIRWNFTYQGIPRP